MDRAEWLAGLKPGDKVAMEQRGFGPKDYWTCTIKHITPTRKRIDIATPYDQTIELDRDGYTKRNGRWDHRNFIQEVTPEIRKTIRIRRLRYKLDKLLLDERNRIREDLTLEQLEAIISLLDVKEKTHADGEENRPEPAQDP